MPIDEEKRNKALLIARGIRESPSWPSDGSLNVVVQVVRNSFTKTVIRATLGKRHEGQEGGSTTA